MSEISSYMYFRSRKEITEHNIIKWAAQEIGPKCQYKRQHDTPSLWSWGRTSRTAGSTRLQHTTTDAKCWQSYVPSYYSENTEENKTKQTGKNTTFAEAWFHRPSLQINLPGTLPTAPSTPTGWSVQETSPLGGWAGLGARGCTSQLERRLALHSARLLPLPAAKLLQAMLFYRLPLSIYTAVHFDLLFQGSSWKTQPISGAAAVVLKGAAAFAPAAAAAPPASQWACLILVTRNFPLSESTDKLVSPGRATNNCGKSEEPLTSPCCRDCQGGNPFVKERRCLGN